MRGAALIGKSVFKGVLNNGGEAVDGYLQLDSGADGVVLNVVDTRTGQLINQMSLGPQRADEVPFTWNGGDFSGSAAEAGRYAFIAQAVRDGKSESVNSFAATRVTGVSGIRAQAKPFDPQAVTPSCPKTLSLLAYLTAGINRRCHFSLH